MDSNALLARMVDQNHWANARAIAWLGEAPDRDPGYARLLVHLLNVEKVWIDRVRGRSGAADAIRGPEDTFRPIVLADMPARNDAQRDAFRDFARGNPDATVAYALFDGTPTVSRMADILLHAWSHGFHHRGQMAAMASAAGLAFPNVAHIAYSRALTP